MKLIETIFDIAYLITVIALGITILRQAKGAPLFRLFGIMAIVLGCGDAFHLVPRVYAMWTTGMAANAAALGFGQFVTSVTMTFFYVFMYHVWRMRYEVTGQKGLTATVYGLAALRIALCCMPQNLWLSPDAPLSWGIYRNIPFAILGVLIIVLYYRSATAKKDQAFRFIWLAIALSFAFYFPVVLFAGTIPAFGAFMLPKTCMYVWIVLMGYRAVREA